MSGNDPSSIHDFCFFGPNGSITPTGDLVIESRAWREQLFAQRAERAVTPHGGVPGRRRSRMQRFIPASAGWARAARRSTSCWS